MRSWCPTKRLQIEDSKFWWLVLVQWPKCTQSLKFCGPLFTQFFLGPMWFSIDSVEGCEPSTTIFFSPVRTVRTRRLKTLWISAGLMPKVHTEFENFSSTIHGNFCYSQSVLWSARNGFPWSPDETVRAGRLKILWISIDSMSKVHIYVESSWSIIHAKFFRAKVFYDTRGTVARRIQTKRLELDG